jgi:nitrogen PTS system EIIA component
MSREDFTIESLARYLHLSVAQITKMTERGQLPGRRIVGQWRFSRAEIHHWLEERLGAGGDEELSHVESVLEADLGAQAEITIAGLLPPEAVAIPLEARTKGSVITSIVEVAGNTGWLWDIGAMIDAVRERENLHSTALENGVALLHPRRPLSDILGQSFLALGKTSSGIPFGNDHGRLTDVFFLICSVDDATHLRLLARLSRLIVDEQFLPSLRSVGSAADAITVIHAAENRLFGIE